MKALVIYMSVHHQNTKKVAEAISKELKAKLVT
ncbi:flavodoxin, partial [archaeon]|nr:flavodoxin [archaeon]